MTPLQLPTQSEIKAVYFDYVVVLNRSTSERDDRVLHEIVTEFESLMTTYPETNISTDYHEGQYIIRIDFDSKESNKATCALTNKYLNEIELGLVRVADAVTDSIYIGVISPYKDFTELTVSDSVNRYLANPANYWKLNEALAQHQEPQELCKKIRFKNIRTQ